MGKTLEFKKPAPRTDLAATILPKVEAAKARVIELESLVLEASLAAGLEEPGAANRLVQVSSQLEAARHAVSLREAAYRLAEQRDAIARAAIDAKARREQLAIMQKHADARLKAMVELCTALEIAAKSYTSFLNETDKMAIAMPTGMVPHVVAWHMIGILLDGREFGARVEAVIAGEMYRHSDLSRADGRGVLGAPPVEKQRLQPAAIEPAVEAVRRMNQWLCGLVAEKLDAIEQADSARFAKTA